jgi:transposase
MIKKLERTLAELKRRLSHYENSNTPPSKNSLLYREMKQKRKEERINRENNENASSSTVSKKPGRKNGHIGVTQIFTPKGNPIIHTMDRCPNCNSTRLSVTSTEERMLVDVPDPLPYNVREHIINVYECSTCGADELLPESVARALPSSILIDEKKRGNGIVTLGRNALSTISLLWSVGRLPQRKISYVIESLYHLKLSAATVGHALEHVSDRLETFHEKIRKKINRSEKANFDETGMPVAGRKSWIWIAATAKYAFVQVAMSRGSDVLETYFPKFKGVAIVDGWKSYSYFSVLQRCWAHPLREAEILSLRTKGRSKQEAEYLLSSLRSLFHETKEALKEHPPPNQKLHDRQLRKLRYILSRKKYSDADVVKFVSKLKSASRNLFTFTLYHGVEPTNSHAERQLREPIVHRKIRGQLKSEKGMVIFSRLMTAVSTWKLQDLNPFLEFKKCL